MRTRSFFFHYNKPASREQQKPVISLHWRGCCLLVENVVVNVPTKGRIRTRQPFFIMTGKAERIDIKDGIATIT